MPQKIQITWIFKKKLNKNHVINSNYAIHGLSSNSALISSSRERGWQRYVHTACMDVCMGQPKINQKLT